MKSDNDMFKKFIFPAFDTGDVFYHFQKSYFFNLHGSILHEKLKTVCLTRCALDTTIATTNDMREGVTEKCKSSVILETMFSLQNCLINSARSPKHILSQDNIDFCKILTTVDVIIILYQFTKQVSDKSFLNVNNFV